MHFVQTAQGKNKHGERTFTSLAHHLKKKSPKIMRVTSKLHKNVKMSPCLTNYALRHEGLCIDPRFLDLGTSWR
jgi:hypothetical protein